MQIKPMAVLSIQRQPSLFSFLFFPPFLLSSQGGHWIQTMSSTKNTTQFINKDTNLHI